MLKMLARWLGRRGASPPDWPQIDSYSTLYSTIPKVDFPDQRAFVDGPLERFIQLVEAESGARGARIMEHLGASVRRFRESEAARGRSTDWLDETVDALVRARFASGSENDQYMIEVFEGRATHNYRASDEEEEE